ncbi:hypothetical protein [Micromonospora sp. NPDC051296]|uniref:hypothetical protein n=1 Tax=Micromonospora sp. NPDC051296 TaxID=3155046 RepID=UPI0034493319
MASEFLNRPGVLPASVVLAVEAGAAVAVLKHRVTRGLEAIYRAIAFLGQDADT